jgi:hypothetical protein
VTLEAIDVTHDELVMNGVSVQMKLAKDSPPVQGDRVGIRFGDLPWTLAISGVPSVSKSRALRCGLSRNCSMRAASEPVPARRASTRSRAYASLYELARVPASLPPSTIRYSGRSGRPSKKSCNISSVPAP